MEHKHRVSQSQDKANKHTSLNVSWLNFDKKKQQQQYQQKSKESKLEHFTSLFTPTQMHRISEM